MSAASDQVVQDLIGFGLQDLAQIIIDSMTEVESEVELYTRLRSTPQYQARFPAMADLQRQNQAGGRAFTEGDYMELENAYRRVFSGSQLPAEFWSSHTQLANLMKNQVSADEVQSRINAAMQAVESTDASTRIQLQRLYGISTTDLMAYALVPDRFSGYISRVAKTAIMAGMASDQGFGTGLTQTQWERYGGEAAAANSSQDEMRSQVADAATLAKQQARLAAVEGGAFTDTDALDVAVRKDAEKALASQQRAKREKARFSGSSGITAATLRGGGAI